MKILVVDDDLVFMRVQKEILEVLGHSADVVSSGNQALREFEPDKYDGIISDIRMPDGDGIFLLEKIR